MRTARLLRNHPAASACAMRLLVAAVTVLAMTASPGAARGEAPADPSIHPRFSLRGSPLPECSSFLITEFGVYYLVNRNGSLSGRRDVFAAFDVGYMRNFDRRNAGGIVVHLGGDDRRTGLGGGLRYRRWLSRRASLNATVGGDLVQVSDEYGTGDLAGLSPWAEVAFTVDDMASVVLRGQDWNSHRMDYRVFPPKDEGSEMTWHLGMKIGGPGGVFATALLIVAGVATITSF